MCLLRGYPCLSRCSYTCPHTGSTKQIQWISFLKEESAWSWKVEAVYVIGRIRDGLEGKKWSVAFDTNTSYVYMKFSNSKNF